MRRMNRDSCKPLMLVVLTMWKPDAQADELNWLCRDAHIALNPILVNLLPNPRQSPAGFVEFGVRLCITEPDEVAPLIP